MLNPFGYLLSTLRILVHMIATQAMILFAFVNGVHAPITEMVVVMVIAVKEISIMPNVRKTKHF